MASLSLPRTLQAAFRRLWRAPRRSTTAPSKPGSATATQHTDVLDWERYRSGTSEFELYELSPHHFTLRRRPNGSKKTD